MPQSKFEHVKVAGLLTVVPQNEICIYDEAQYYNNSVKKIDRMRKIVGFWKRRVADIGTTPSDLAIDAAKKLFEQSGIDKKTIDVLIFVVQKPDVINPATAFYIHRELDLPKSCMSFDINQGCPGWVYGMHVAHAMVESKACKRVLLLAGDTPAEYADPKDGEYCVIGVGRPDIRKKIFDDLKAMGAKFYTLIAYDCLIGETVKFGEANIIFSSSFTSEITAGDGNLFNGEVIVGHDCKIGNFNFFAPRTNILGNVKIGDGNTIGTGSVLLPNCKIGDNNKIAPLSAVYRGCKNDCHMLGNPAMKI